LWLLSKEKPRESVWFLNIRAYMSYLGVIIGAIVYLNGNIELQYHDFAINDVKRLWISIYNSVFALALWALGVKLNVVNLKKVGDYIMIFFVFTYFFYVHFSVVDLRNEYVVNNQSFAPFALHYVNVLLAGVMLWLLITDTYKRQGENSAMFGYLIWFVCFATMAHASLELDHFVVLLGYNVGDNIDDLLEASHKVGYVLLWTFFSFGLMLAGMRYKLKDLRVIALVIFAVTLLKFFIFNFKDLSTFSKIISMIVIGVIFLIVSFLYSQLRAMIENGEFDLKNIKNTVIKPKQPENTPPPPSNFRNSMGGEDIHRREF
jgi:uncharacterized membrane protein